MAYCSPVRCQGRASTSSKASSSGRLSGPHAAANWTPMSNPFRLNPKKSILFSAQNKGQSTQRYPDHNNIDGTGYEIGIAHECNATDNH